MFNTVFTNGTFASYSAMIRFNIIGVQFSPVVSFYEVFEIKLLFTVFVFHIRATRPTYLIVFDFIILIIYCEEFEVMKLVML